MNCAELRLRAAEAPARKEVPRPDVDEHVASCSGCEQIVGVYAAIDRLYRIERTGQPPADLEAQVLERLKGGPAAPARKKLPIPAIAGAAVAVVAGLAVVLFGRGGSKIEPAAAPVRKAAAAPKAAEAAAVSGPLPASRRALPTPSLGDSGFITTAPQLSAAEKQKVSALHDAEFLQFLDTLEALDVFYPEDEPVLPALPHADAPPVRPGETEEHRELRYLYWSRLPQAERARLESLDEKFRLEGEARRNALWSRWTIVAWFPAEEKLGLRRLVSRLAELDSAPRAEAMGQVRVVSVEPVENRGLAWREQAFTKRLTGQEQTAGERLLISR